MMELIMPDGFRSLGEVIKRERSFGRIREIVKSYDVIEDFYDIFPNLEKVVTPKNLEKKTLMLKVENPVWRSELKFMETEVMEKINSYYKEERVKQIRFIG
jgi:hypothetical protein